MPSDGEQAALEKTNIYSFEWELAQAVSCDWRLARPTGRTQQEALRETGRCPRGHRRPGQGLREGDSVLQGPSRHVSCRFAHLRRGALTISLSPVGQPCEKVHPTVSPVFLASGPCSDPWGLRKCAENKPSGQRWSGLASPSQSQWPPASLPQALAVGSVARADCFWGGREEGLALGAPLSLLQLCSFFPENPL